MNKKFKIIIIVLIVLFLLFIAGHAKLQSSNNLDNILIFNLYKNQKNISNKYNFNINSGIKKISNVRLHNTFNRGNIVNEKIAPGTSGEFEILLSTSKDVKYQVRFDSKNDKPRNMLFNIKGTLDKYSHLEDLEEKLRGVLKRNTTEKIVIQWVWEYETNRYANSQDTLDGKNIAKYSFDINVLSYEI